MRAITKDGYLVNQALMRNIPYGIKPSSDNGCGWIAAYNVLHACGITKEWNAVREQMEDWLLFGGMLGTHLVHLLWYLRRHGLHLQIAMERERREACAELCRAGILFYFNGVALHFVTFLPATSEEIEAFVLTEQSEEIIQEEAYYRFLNGRMGRQRDYDTMKRFLEKENRSPLLIQITIPQKRFR